MRNMEKETLFDPFAFEVPEFEVHHKEFTDPLQPGQTLILSLHRAGTIERARGASELQRMMRLYITGSDELPPGPFPTVGGAVVPVSTELFAEACGIAEMQAPPEKSKQPRLWSPEHLVAISITMPSAWEAVLRFANELNRPGRRAEGNGSAPPME